MWLRAAIGAVGFAFGFVVVMPWSCWQADCPPGVGCRSSGCDNLLGMTFGSISPWVGLLGGIAGAALLLLIAGALRWSTR